MSVVRTMSGVVINGFGAAFPRTFTYFCVNICVVRTVSQERIRWWYRPWWRLVEFIVRISVDIAPNFWRLFDEQPLSKWQLLLALGRWCCHAWFRTSYTDDLCYCITFLLINWILTSTTRNCCWLSYFSTYENERTVKVSFRSSVRNRGKKKDYVRKILFLS